MLIGPEKKCHNECGSGWCCHNEFFVDAAARFDKASIELLNFKGISVKQFPMGDARRFQHVILKVPVNCKQMTKNGCKLKNKRPDMCKVFPTSVYHDWVLSPKCKFFEPDKHWDWDGLTDFEPEE